MGGKALKNTKIIRINLITLNNVKEIIKKKISDELEIDFMIENPEKTDFGDIDIIYKINSDNKIIVKELIEKLFSPVEMVVNGDIISFAYPSDIEGEFIQIDFIKCKNLNMSKFYFSYGDFGNILGYITNYYNIKLGHFGLYVNISRDMFEDNKDIDVSNCHNFTQQIYLTEEPEKICEFFQLDFSNWNNFDCEEKIFNWICSSPFFSKKIYEKLNNKIRHKIDVRPMYGRFINWISNLDECVNNFDKYDYRMEAIKYFNLEWKLNDIINLNKIIYQRKQKFNGNKIMEKEYLQSNKELGDFIIKFKNYIINENGDFDIWLDNNNSESIDNKIKLFVTIYNTNNIL